MDRINPTNPTDWIEPTLSFDNDSYFDLSIPLQVSSTGSPLLGPRTASPDTTNTDRVGPRVRRAEYMAAHQQTSNADQYAYNDPSYVSRTPSRTSRPTSRPSSRPDRISVSPGAAYARYRGEDNLDIDVVQRVLGPPRRRRTPSLRRAPHVQWDTTRPLRTAPSFSTTGGSVVEDDASIGREESGLDGHADGTVRDALRHHLEHTQLPQQSPLTPNPTPRDPVPNHDDQPHRLSPLEERPEPLLPTYLPELAQSRRYRNRWHPTDPPPTPPDPGSPRPRPRQITYSLDDTYDGENASIRSAEEMPMRRVTHEEVRGAEISIGCPQSAGHVWWVPGPAGDAIRDNLWRAREMEYDGIVCDLQRRVKEKRCLKGKAKKYWGKVRRFFGRRRRG